MLFINAIKSIAVKIDVLDGVKILTLLLFFELLAVHSRAQLGGDLVHLGIRVGIRILASLAHDDAQGVYQATLRVVELWQRDREVKDVDKLVGLVLNGLSQIDKVLIHDKGLLCLSLAKTGESLQDLSDVRIVDTIDLHQVLK